jgi:cyclopropane fatty-acyl-phospholipid synthase-like methyltransferase
MSSSSEIMRANVEVYNSRAESYRRSRDTYLGVMRRDMASFLELLRQNGAKRVLDVGSGAGVHAQVVCEAGFEVTCIDAAPAMLQVVRDNVPGASCELVDFWEYEPAERFDGVILASFIHLFPKSHLQRLFSRVSGWLNPGAVGWIATVPGEPSDGAWMEKEDNHENARRWRVVYSDVELRAAFVEAGLVLADTIIAADGIHGEKIWVDYVVRWP